MSIVEKIEDFSTMLKISNFLAILVIISSIISIFGGFIISVMIIDYGTIDTTSLHLIAESTALITLGIAGLVTYLRERSV